LSDELEKYLEGLLPREMMNRSLAGLQSQLSPIRNLFKQRHVPVLGWRDDVIALLLKLLSMMDLDKDPEAVKIGEREARVASPLISELAQGFCHGIGRSGTLIAPQPKAPGASVMYELANRCALDAIQKFGAPNMKRAMVSPFSTGMSLALALAAAREESSNERKTVVYPRIDHDSPMKAIRLVNLKAKIIDGMIDGDAVRVSVDDVGHAVDKNCCAILSTTTFFPPREPDSIKEIARIAAEQNVFHIINNAYGVQSREIMRAIRSAADVGRVDAIVQSTDKNFLTAVGGAIIASPDDKFAERVATYYAGRASASPIYQFLGAILSLGIEGYEKLRDAQESNRSLLQKLLTEVADACNERVLNVKNQIACAMTISRTDPSTLGGVLYSLRLSGPRVVQLGQIGSCCNDYPNTYIVMNAAIGSKEADIIKATEKLKQGLNQASAKKTDRKITGGTPRPASKEFSLSGI
jgi:O-phospho-L-seryl-tRNASec:L-selenocysteinyl-tRNA synthase